MAKMDFKGTGYGIMDWFPLAQDRNTAINLHVP
jgi:hypothetical protein